VKGQFSGRRRLDERESAQISAFLFGRGGHIDPVALRANQGVCFLGTNVVGEGFKFAGSVDEGEAWPLSVMDDVVRMSPGSAARIFPFIGGSEINDSPTQANTRFIIDFGDLSEAEARSGWPALMALVEKRVKPKRQRENREAYRRYWWRHGERRVELYRQLAEREHVFACSQTSKYRAFVRMPARMVFSTKAVVITDACWPMFAVVQSRLHEVWSRSFGSTMKDDPVYTPSDCFETYPFTPAFGADASLAKAGRAYHECRAAVMLGANEGLTGTYNRFHDPDERDAGILRLRELHAAMDRAVLDAYGWTDIKTDCEFLLDYEIDEEEWGDKKKPWRYRWPDEVREEVLARLLELNAQRAAEEARSGAAAEVAAPAKAAKTGAKKGSKTKKQKDSKTGDLF
jgi:hypothetical protein